MAALSSYLGDMQPIRNQADSMSTNLNSDLRIWARHSLA
jgi:hypothetical protein